VRPVRTFSYVSVTSGDSGGRQSLEPLFYAVVCWGSRVKAADANRLNKLIRKAGSVLGVELESGGGGLGEEDAE